MFRFEQQKSMRGACGKKTIKKVPRVRIDQICDCSSGTSPEQMCASGPRGCTLSTKAIKKLPFLLDPLMTFEDLTQKREGEIKDFVEGIKRKSQSVLIERPKDTHVKLLMDKLYENDVTGVSQCLHKTKRTRPVRILSNREIMNKVMRRKALRERKCGERLGPHQQCDPMSVVQDIFLLCKPDRHKNCMQKKKHLLEDENTRKKDFKEVEIQTDESYIGEMKSKLVTKEALEEEEMKKLREVQQQKEEKKRLRKLKRDASLTVLDWNVKPNPCKTLLNEDGECPEKDVNDSDEDSDEDLLECTCKSHFNCCHALDFLRRKDYKHNWMPIIQCSTATQGNQSTENKDI